MAEYRQHPPREDEEDLRSFWSLPVEALGWGGLVFEGHSKKHEYESGSGEPSDRGLAVISKSELS